MEKTTILKRLEDVKGKEDIDKLITELRLDIVATNKVGKFNVKNYFKKFYNSIDIYYRPAFKGFYKLNDKWIICDGYKLVELQNPRDNEIAEALEVVNKAEKYTIDYENIKSPELTEHKIDMDLLQKTINYNKTQKKESKIPYIDNFDDKGTKIGINAEWLYDLLQLNNTDTVGYGTTPVSPVSITSDDYKCILLPIKLTEEKLEKMRKLKEELEQQ